MFLDVKYFIIRARSLQDNTAYICMEIAVVFDFTNLSTSLLSLSVSNFVIKLSTLLFFTEIYQSWVTDLFILFYMRSVLYDIRIILA